MAKKKTQKASKKKAKQVSKSDDKDLKLKLSKLRKKVKQLKAAAVAPADAAPAAGPKVSPLAPASFPDLPEIAGVRFAVARAGVRYKGRDDVMLAELAPGTQVAGVFTRSATRSAPVLDCEAKIGKPAQPDQPSAILVNAGNSNAFTGSYGERSVQALTQAVGAALNVAPERVFTSSTGVIGEPLPHERIEAVLAQMAADLTPAGAKAAAGAIMTTDTYPKGATATIEIDGTPVTITGIAKGSGMIAPDMATMLVYIFTDAAIRHQTLQRLLSRLTDETFNCITVDGDTSTSDTLLVAATGQSGATEIRDLRSRPARDFADALKAVMLDLSHQVVRDGEGATKFAEIRVTGATRDADAHKVAMAIANSPLVKTALAGEDPNWGRIVMAVGKSGAHANRDKLSIRFGDILVAENGWVAESYTEEAGATYMKQSDLVIAVDLGLGRGAATAWTCDLTYDYIRINADYRS
ncbi:bifunctional glutamate N-acetyltransferase/amino-acid acetyltransferase ArgJ [Actibacterium ureilyticum]|uniref:bifunctional glutamate N-acetyltransferase/amino-acid acetyltransferase ArgJ n=1 Tax=Actibacterium ureilyticum TaxID=1590614 RepID=UPI000BAB10EF|nr:bifunctional glutamate N-acetyltransferase/amino-acid acetyltransferase ArgJ [Actibacterium ureilyticum]